MKIPFSERILHFEEYFFDQFKAFPQRFLALPYFNSVNREILEQVKEILPNILGVLINNENSEYNLKLEDSSNLIFSSFDIDKLNSSNNSGKNDGNENENEQNFYSFVTIERFDHKVEDIIENSKENKSKEFMFNLGILLQINEVLPENTIINIENSLKKVLMENLTSPSTSNSKNISRKKLFNSILDFLETLETHEFKEIVVKYEKKVPYLNDFRIRKESFEKLHTNINFLFKRFSKLILIVNTFKCEFLDFDHGYSSSFIISEPVQFQTLFNSKFPMFKGIKKIFILYQIMIRNLRFKDFCLKHQELNKYDDFFYHFINIHKDAMIERIIKSHKNLLQIDVLNNLHLFEDILIKYQKAFEINSTPYEKLNILHKYDKILRNRLIHHFPEFQEDISNAAEFLVPLQILCFILANPQKYVSNFVYIDMFYTNSSWKITNQKIRIAQDILSLISEIFYSKTLFLDFINMESFKINVYCICDEENFLSMARFLDYNGIYEIINPPRIVHKHHDLLQPFELLLFNEIIFGVNYDAIVVFTKDADFITKVIKSHKSIKQRFIYCNWKSYKELKLTNSRIHYIDSDKRYNEVHNTICKVFANLNEVLEV